MEIQAVLFTVGAGTCRLTLIIICRYRITLSLVSISYIIPGLDEIEN